MDYLSEIDMCNANSKVLNLNQEIIKLNQEIIKLQEKINVGGKIRKKIEILNTQEPSQTNMTDLNAKIMETENLIASLKATPNSGKGHLGNVPENLNQVLQVQEDACSHLECIICLEIPLASIQIYSCQEDHILCQICKSNPTIKSCPMCRQNFEVQPPRRNRLAEKMIEALK